MRITGLELASGGKEGEIFLSAVPSCSPALDMAMNIMIQQREWQAAMVFSLGGSVDERLCQVFFFICIYNTVKKAH